MLEAKRHPCKWGAIATGMALLFSGCAGAPKPLERTAPFPASQQPVPYKKMWTRRVPGLLTDLNLSQDGSTVLVATVPDKDSLDPRANRNQYFGVIYSAAGKALSEIKMPAQIKSQTLSDDGELAVIATYDDQIRAFDRNGKLLWDAEAYCRPTAMSAIKKILCFHDDDAEPDVGFEVFDWAGKKISEFPIKNDALVLKVAPDEKHFILALTRGKLIVFDQHFKPIARKTVPGEIVDVAIASASSYAVLYNKRKSDKQMLAFFGSKPAGKKPLPISERTDQIELSPDGRAVFGYSNGSDGQKLLRFSRLGSETWSRSNQVSAEYSSQIATAPDEVWIGFEDADQTSIHNHVLGFDANGGLKTQIVVPGEEGSFLYTFSIAPKDHRVAVGSDDGHLSLFGEEHP